MPTRNCESQASGSRAAAEGSGAESGEAEGLGDGQRTESRPPARQSADKMKALQKSQGRTDQILGAMADMLTSLALPNQQWTGESGEAEQAVDEEARPAAAAAAQGPWERDQESQDWEQGSQDSMEKGQREPEAQSHWSYSVLLCVSYACVGGGVQDLGSHLSLPKYRGDSAVSGFPGIIGTAGPCPAAAAGL
ncbi:hypothetical protein AALO_G00055500 [Alosa alosa]|uniref:Uncharacterized protein n=1 Tax=Alosa alosa TaxID=278164 RepID=A0AAV6H4Y9_9TELE|nr:hypothetical protein AALO_G00055500 [Alosa alosa]